jgi:hypothetical protein
MEHAMRLLAVIAIFCCSLARAQWQDQYAGLWFNPDQPGWGVSVQQQGDRMRVTLLVYGSDGQARWFFAPDVRLDPYDWYYAPLWSEDTVTVGSRLYQPVANAAPLDVGTLVLTLGQVEGEVRYAIGGARATSRIVRAGFARTEIEGSFAGVQAASLPQTCGASSAEPLVLLTLNRSGDDVRLRLENGAASCDVQGKYTEAGPLGSISGRAQCQGMGRLVDASFEARGVRMQRDSISLDYFMLDRDCEHGATVNATRVSQALPSNAAPHNDMSGNWRAARGSAYDPIPADWSIAVHHQGNTIFAIVLAPAADGKPAWYVASSMGFADGQDDDFTVFHGELWSTTGTPYSRVYDRSQLQARRVGDLELSFDSYYSMAAFDIDGFSAAPHIERDFRPSDTQISGSWAGVRTNLMQAPATATAVLWTIQQQSIEVRMTLKEAARTCDIVGTLQWRGLAGEIEAGATCRLADGATRTAPFYGREVRLTEQGLSMRYAFFDESGVIAAAR